MYSEDELLPISGLQHLMFCERQCALIYGEQVWEENRLTAEGGLLHERVHDGANEVRGDTRVVRGLRLRSLELGVSGIADVVEFVTTPGEQGTRLPGAAGWWQPHPVEYKRGRPKPDDCDRVQLCAQAICLEEMLGTQVPTGAVFYGQPRRRLQVDLDDQLRKVTRLAARRLHELLASGVTPTATETKKCRRCSLRELCLPAAAGGVDGVRRYLDEAIR